MADVLKARGLLDAIPPVVGPVLDSWRDVADNVVKSTEGFTFIPRRTDSDLVREIMTDHTAALIAALSGAVDDIVLQVESILGDAIFSKVLGQEDLERARRIVELNMASIQEGARPDLDAEVVPLPAARIFASNWAAFYHTEVLDTCDREEAMRHHGERLLNSLDAAEARRSRCA